jgi:hypothetical protein
MFFGKIDNLDENQVIFIKFDLKVQTVILTANYFHFYSDLKNLGKISIRSGFQGGQKCLLR